MAIGFEKMQRGSLGSAVSYQGSIYMYMYIYTVSAHFDIHCIYTVYTAYTLYMYMQTNFDCIYHHSNFLHKLYTLENVYGRVHLYIREFSPSLFKEIHIQHAWLILFGINASLDFIYLISVSKI